MKFKYLVIVLLMLIVTLGCGSKNEKGVEKNNWGNELFFNTVEKPAVEITSVNCNTSIENKQSYTVIADKCSYEEFYNYIMKLEAEGFHYGFVNENVPATVDELSDQTATAWSANNGKVWIIANWCSDENRYYNGYDMQIIFYNYDYTK